MIAVLGGAGAALAWALSTLCSSRSSRLIEPVAVVAWMMLVGLLITAPLALVSGVPAKLDGASGTWLVVAGVGNVAGLVLEYAALRIGKVALVVPLASTEGAIAAVIAFVAGEAVSPGVGVTLLVIVVGVCMAAVPADTSREATVSVHVSQARSVLLALLAACSFGAGLYGAAKAGASLPTAWVVLSARLVGTLALALPLLASRRLRLTRRALPLVLVAGLCEVLGFYSFVAGSRHGIAVAAVMGSQFAGLAAVAAYLVFKERLARIQVMGVSTVIVGVAVLSALRA